MKKFNRKKPNMLTDIQWKYTRVMRKVEYLTNCKRGLFWKFILKYHRFKLYRIGVKSGLTIPPNVFGPGLALFHYGTIVVDTSARVGRDCQLYCSTNIADGVKIGEKVFIAPGVVISSNVTIADGVRIGANSVVTRSILEPNITVAGAPAKKISDIGTTDHYLGGTERLEQSSSGG